MADRLGSLTLALVAGAAAWLTLGAQAIVQEAPQVRAGVLPPYWWLAALQAAFVLAIVARRVSVGRLWPLALLVLVGLPWLPGPMPPAFLIWTGPAAALVWLAVAIGLAMPVLRSARARAGAWLDHPRRAPWVLAVLVLTLEAAGAWALRTRIPDGDEPHYLIITQSLLLDGDLRIENNHRRRDYLTYMDRDIPPDYVQRGVDGEIYSIHAPGVSAMVAPAFAVARWPGAVAVMVIGAAATSALIWLTVWRLTGGDGGAAWVTGLSFALTSPGYFHGFTVFPDGPGALFVAVALLFLVRLEGAATVSPAHALACGAALAVLPWLHTRFAVLAGGLGLVFGLRLWERPERGRLLAAFFTIPAISAAAWAAFFWTIWGTPNPAAPYGQATQSAWAHLKPAIPGLLFDQQFGLLPNAPIYALSLLGFWSLSRRHQRLALETGVLCVGYLIAVGTYRMWWGGHSAPARFLVAALPLLALPLAAWWQRSSPARRTLTMCVLTLGLVLTAVRAAVEGGILVYNERDGVDRFLDWATRLVSLPVAVPSLHRDVVGDALVDIAVWCATAGVLLTTAVWVATRYGQRGTWSAAGLALTGMAAATMIWNAHDHALARERSVVHLLSAWPLGDRGVFWQSTPFGAVPGETMLSRLAVTDTPAAGPRPRGVLFEAPLVPAGEYVIDVREHSPGERLHVTAGGASLLLEELDGRLPPGAEPPRLRLPVHVRGLRIIAEGEAGSAPRLALRPTQAGAPATLRGLTAIAAARYGTGRVFAFDENVDLEPAGLWTRGGSTTTILIDPPGQPLSLTLRAGPVPTRVRVDDGEGARLVDLDPGEATVVDFRIRPEPRPLHVTTTTGFRPAEHDAASTDLRYLGVWIETGPEPTASTATSVAVRSERRP